MKIIVFITVLFIGTAARGQTLRGDTISTAKWMLGAGISPDIAYRSLQDVGEGATHEAYLNERNEKESFRFGGTAGVHVNYFFSPSFALGTGVFYSVKGYRMARQPFNAIAQHPNDPAIPVARSFDVDYRFLDVPFQAVVFFGKGRLRSVSSLGLVYNIFLNARSTLHYEYADGRIEQVVSPAPPDFRPFMLSAAISSGFDYRFTDHLHFRFEPNFRHAIFSTDERYVFKQYLWNAGVDLGVYVDLK